MNAVSIDTCSCMVRALIACFVTILCLALVGRDCAVIAGIVFPVSFLENVRLSGSSRGVSVFGIRCTLLIGDNSPIVFFLVTLVNSGS